MEEMDTASPVPVSGNVVSVNGSPNGSREVEGLGESLEAVALPPKCHSTDKNNPVDLEVKDAGVVKSLKPLKIGKASSPRNAAAAAQGKSKSRKEGSKPHIASNGSDASESNQRQTSAAGTKGKSSSENHGSGSLKATSR